MADQPRPSDPASPAADEVVPVSVRRSPKYSVFLLLGAALGVFVAMILTFAFSGTDNVSPNTGIVYNSAQVFGFLALIGAAAGLAVGGAVALLLDRVVGRRTRELQAGHARIHVSD